MIRISRMRIGDIPFAVKLSAQEDWGTPRSDFLRILRINPHGSFVASEAFSRIGMITTVTFGKDLAWIGNVIVDKKHRGKRIGQRMVRNALAHLKGLHVKHIALYCFKDNIGFYRKLGFVEDARFVRLRRSQHDTGPFKKEPREQLTLVRLLSVDRKAFGADRSEFIQSWINERAGTYFGFAEGRTSAFLFLKKYPDMFDFGPGVSFGASDDDLCRLLAESVNYARNKPIEVSCLAQNRNMLKLLHEFGFEVTNIGYRMSWGHSAILGFDSANILLGFLDKG